MKAPVVRDPMLARHLLRNNRPVPNLQLPGHRPSKEHRLYFFFATFLAATLFGAALPLGLPLGAVGFADCLSKKGLQCVLGFLGICVAFRVGVGRLAIY